MAFMNQERKAEIAKNLKTVVPKDWKYTLKVDHHAVIVMTIRRGPESLMMVPSHWETLRPDPQYIETGLSEKPYRSINVYHWRDAFIPELHETIGKIMAALNNGNWDKSDVMTDYFNVGWYVELHIGDWDKPFEIA